MKTNIPKTITNLWSCYTTSKKNNSSVSNCSVREGFIDLIKNTSKIFLILVYSEFPRAFRPSLYFLFLVYYSCTPRIFRMVIWWAKANYSTTTVFINEKFAKNLIKKLVVFTNKKCKFNVAWNTRNIRSLFQIKDNIEYYSCVVYEGNCSCGENCRWISEKCCFKMGLTWRSKSAIRTS